MVFRCFCRVLTLLGALFHGTLAAGGGWTIPARAGVLAQAGAPLDDGSSMALDPSKRPADWVLAQARRRSHGVWVSLGLVGVAAAVVASAAFGRGPAWLAALVLA